MLGHAVLRIMSERSDWSVFGTVRSTAGEDLSNPLVGGLLSGLDMMRDDAMIEAFGRARPDVVVNCVGLVKQIAEAQDHLKAIQINALLPHRLAKLCELAGARLIHISTDCVYSGKKGRYKESDFSDAEDLYGRSKFLGEVDYPRAVTLRTSIIGHELRTNHGLIEWFLSQQDACAGYTRAIFSGLPTVVLATMIRDVVISHPELHGVYHVAAEPISKYELLKLVAEVYGKKIDIRPDDKLVIDRSLDATKLREATGYVAPAWRQMIETMYAYR